MGMSALTKVQIASQPTLAAGAQAATHIMRIEDTNLIDKRMMIHPKTAVGRMVPPPYSYTGSTYAEMTMNAVATYEELPYILEAGLMLASPTNPGSGTGYLYTYTFPITAQQTLRYYTIEWADDQQEYEVPGAFVRNFSLNWTAPTLPGGDGCWHYSSLWGGQTVAKSTATTVALSAVPETIKAPTICVDANLATPGATQVELTLLAATFQWQENIPIVTAEGSTTYARTKQNVFDNVPTLTLTFEHDATGEAAYDAWVAGTQHVIQLESTGSALTGTYTYKTMTLDFYGTITQEPTWGRQQGDNTITVVYENRYYDAETDVAGQILIANALSALP